MEYLQYTNLENIILKETKINFIVIFVFLFTIAFLIIGSIFFNYFNKKNTNNDKREKQEIESFLKNNNEINLNKEINIFFKEFQKDYKNIGKMGHIKVSDVNEKYKNKLKTIISSTEFEQSFNDKKSTLYNECVFLKGLDKVSPFVWNKKNKKEIKEIYESTKQKL